MLPPCHKSQTLLLSEILVWFLCYQVLIGVIQIIIMVIVLRRVSETCIFHFQKGGRGYSPAYFQCVCNIWQKRWGKLDSLLYVNLNFHICSEFWINATCAANVTGNYPSAHRTHKVICQCNRHVITIFHRINAIDGSFLLIRFI